LKRVELGCIKTVGSVHQADLGKAKPRFKVIIPMGQTMY
jgi:hypothetical protein